jgi:hypothetical protein
LKAHAVSLPGYDAWKCRTPPEWEDEMDSGEQCILIARDVYEADHCTVSERAECEIEVEAER